MSEVKTLFVKPTSQQNNYVSPEGSYDNILSSDIVQPQHDIFTLYENDLSGNYHPFSANGWLSSVISDADGNLPEPVIINLEGNFAISILRIVGNAFTQNFPVSFSYKIFKGENILYEDFVETNDQVAWEKDFKACYEVTKVELTITKISKGNSAVHLLNFSNPYIRNKIQVFDITTISKTVISIGINLQKKLELPINISRKSFIYNTIKKKQDTASFGINEKSALRNVHTIMKEPNRQVFGKVTVVYFNPLLELVTEIISSGGAHLSNLDQLSDSKTGEMKSNYFTLFDNKLDGSYVPYGKTSQVGWVSKELTDVNGVFSTPPTLSQKFSQRLLSEMSIYFDNNKDTWPTEFDVVIHSNKRENVTITIQDFEGLSWKLPDDYAEVTQVDFIFKKMNKPFYPATVTELTISSSVTYEQDHLVSIDLLEELGYEDTVTNLGCISANEVNITFDNTDKAFFFNNKESLIAPQLKKNRKVLPYLGAEIVPGVVEWYPLGTFWSYNWNVPSANVIASVTAMDTLSLLDTLSFTEHQVYQNKSVGELFEIILQDAKKQFTLLEWDIDESLYDLIIPYTWFDASSHAQALKRLAKTDMIDVFADRKGRVRCQYRYKATNVPLDTWSDNTNVKSKNYPTLYSDLPNYVEVKITEVTVLKQELLNITQAFDISSSNLPSFVFSYPYVDNAEVLIDCDETVVYNYNLYSWGMKITFTGSGKVRSVKVTGDSLSVTTDSSCAAVDEQKINLDGLYKVTIDSEFIQDSDRANKLAKDLLQLASLDAYYVEVDYSGDISLSISDSIKLLNGIAPKENYIISRHELYWDGSLMGSATLIS